MAARERLSKLEEERKQRTDEETTEAELRLVIGQLEEFARRVSSGLQDSDWLTRREIIRALVKRVEIDEQEVRIVYRVSPSPFEGGPQQGRVQHCWGRSRCAFRPPGYPHRRGRESGFRPRKLGGSPLRAVSGAGSRSALSVADSASSERVCPGTGEAAIEPKVEVFSLRLRLILHFAKTDVCHRCGFVLEFQMQGDFTTSQPDP